MFPKIFKLFGFLIFFYRVTVIPERTKRIKLDFYFFLLFQKRTKRTKLDMYVFIIPETRHPYKII